METGSRHEGGLEVGSVFAARYQVLEVLGHGASSTVYKVRHLQTDQVAALKVLLAGQMNQSSRLRFEREAKILSTLVHPNVARFFAFGETTDGSCFILMEYIHGCTLSDLPDSPANTHNITIADNIELIKQVCSAMQYVHAHGLVHRDLKPGNILIEQVDGVCCAKIVDFGIVSLSASASETDQKLTATGVVLGSLGFMSPEQLMGKPADHRSDIYSVGCILYWLVAGQPPVTGNWRAPVSELPAKNIGLGYDCKLIAPPELKQVIDKCLEIEVDRRYQSMSELCEALTQVRFQPMRLGHPRKKAMLGGALICLLLALTAVVVCHKKIPAVPDCLYLKTGSTPHKSPRIIVYEELKQNVEGSPRQRLQYYGEWLARFDCEPDAPSKIPVRYHRIAAAREGVLVAQQELGCSYDEQLKLKNSCIAAWQKAVAHADPALREKDRLGMVYTLSKLLEDVKRPHDALSVLNEQLSGAKPESRADIYEHMAMVQKNCKRFEAAEQSLRSALNDSQPGGYRIKRLAELVLLLLNQGKREEAAKTLKIAEEESAGRKDEYPRDWNFKLGQAEMESGAFAKALPLFERGFDGVPFLAASSFFYAASCCVMVNDYQKARIYYRKAYSIMGDYPGRWAVIGQYIQLEQRINPTFDPADFLRKDMDREGPLSTKLQGLCSICRTLVPFDRRDLIGICYDIAFETYISATPADKEIELERLVDFCLEFGVQNESKAVARYLPELMREAGRQPLRIRAKAAILYSVVDTKDARPADAQKLLYDLIVEAGNPKYINHERRSLLVMLLVQLSMAKLAENRFEQANSLLQQANVIVGQVPSIDWRRRLSIRSAECEVLVAQHQPVQKMEKTLQQIQLMCRRHDQVLTYIRVLQSLAEGYGKRHNFADALKLEQMALAECRTMQHIDSNFRERISLYGQQLCRDAHRLDLLKEFE